MKFELINLEMETIREAIQTCEKEGHIQQVAYSTYHDCLTQICFTCEKIRTLLEVKK